MTLEIELHISDDILSEIMRVLHDKFRWSDEALALTKDRIADFTKTIQPGQAVQIVTKDPTDNKILECALAGKSDYVVTGDKHLLDLGQVGDVKILKPADFLHIRSKEVGKGR